MISKEAFCDILNEVRDYYDELQVIEKYLGVVFEDNQLTKIVDHTIDILSEEIEDQDDWVYYFAWEMDFGRDENAATSVTVGDEARPLTSAAELYDLVKELNEK